MKICVFGAGAVGGHIAAKLAASGNDVSVVARGPHLQAVQRNGLKLLHGDETILGRVRAAERAAELGPQDCVIVTLKANMLDRFAEQAAPLLGADTSVVFAQNGIPWWYPVGLAARGPRPPDLSSLDPGGKLKRAIAAERIIGAAVYSANAVVEPGVIRNFVPGRNMLVVGEPDDSSSERIGQLRKTLERSGISSPPSPDIRQSVWTKLTQNLGNSTLCVLTEATVGAVRGDQALSKLLERMVEEARAIMQAHGIPAEGAVERPGGGQSSGMIAHKPSMLQDYEKGRPMEIEAQLMAPLAFGRAGGVATPTLDALIPVAAFKAAAKGLYTMHFLH
jgi:2-dehydropantoate 2-reductase